MKHDSMSQAHQCATPGPWLLGPQMAVSLRAEPFDRGLWVHEGRVWLTAQAQAQDIWLQAGQGHTLPAGTCWVAEAWPQASVSLVQAPRFSRAAASPAASSLPWGRLGSWVHAVLQTLQRTRRRLLAGSPRSAAC